MREYCDKNDILFNRNIEMSNNIAHAAIHRHVYFSFYRGNSIFDRHVTQTDKSEQSPICVLLS